MRFHHIETKLKGKGVCNVKHRNTDQLLHTTKKKISIDGQNCRQQTYQTLHNFIRYFVEIHLVINIYSVIVNRARKVLAPQKMNSKAMGKPGSQLAMVQSN
uniref:Uncharacterized protein n=1 Tax=Arundo donax TaxID=35708 RepID=A0A0A9AUC9_ARUDO